MDGMIDPSNGDDLPIPWDQWVREHRNNGVYPGPTCPVCDSPIVIVTSIGPTDHIAGPCGCRVPADVLRRDEDDVE